MDEFSILKTSQLFDGWEETMIYSCLDGTMGTIYGNEKSAVCYLGDFVFVAGTPCVKLLQWTEGLGKSFLIFVSKNEDWHPLIVSYFGYRAKRSERYAIKKEASIFDVEQLEKIVGDLKRDYELCMIGEEEYLCCQKVDFLKDLVAQYPTYADYARCGLGCVIKKGDRIVSGASSYSSYQGGIEIEIDTHIDERRKGLALVCGAKLILECLKRNLYPSWDAQNKGSVALAEKLGYHYDHTYPIYEVNLQAT